MTTRDPLDHRDPDPAGSRRVDPADPADRPTLDARRDAEMRPVEPAPAAVVDDRRDLFYQLQVARMNNKASTDIGLLVLRVLAAMLILHGVKKAMGYDGFVGSVRNNWFGALAPDVFGFLVVAGQILLPIALLLGLLTRISGLLLAVMMGFIAFVFVLPNSGWLDARTGGLTMESSLLYLAIGLALFFTGGGRYSIDHALGARGRQARAERRATRAVA